MGALDGRGAPGSNAAATDMGTIDEGSAANRVSTVRTAGETACARLTVRTRSALCTEQQSIRTGVGSSAQSGTPSQQACCVRSDICATAAKQVADDANAIARANALVNRRDVRVRCRTMDLSSCWRAPRGMSNSWAQARRPPRADYELDPGQSPKRGHGWRAGTGWFFIISERPF